MPHQVHEASFRPRSYPPGPAVEADQTFHAADIQLQYVSGACSSQPDSALATIDIIE